MKYFQLLQKTTKAKKNFIRQVGEGLKWGNKTKVIQTGPGIFTHISTYLEVFRNYSGIFRTLYNPGIFRTLVYSESETEACSEPCRKSTMEQVAKIVNRCSCFCKLFLQQLFPFSTYFNKNLYFTPKVFIPYKKIQWSRGVG